MDFRTVVELPPPSLALVPASRVVLAGSCFAAHIGRRLADSLLDGQVDVNPNGVLYNPESILQALRGLEGDAPQWGEGDFFEGRDGLWHSWMHSGDFSAPTRGECLHKATERWQRAREVYAAAELLVVTFSSDRAYRLRGGDGRVVANCHKEPASRFEDFTLDFQAMLSAWSGWLGELARRCPSVRVLFTLSPYRYLKYGLQESQFGKARLLHLVDELLRANGNALYFPAYEIVVDELRDYRFYDRDMLHPSPQAVDYVWERFSQWAFSPRLQEFAKEKEALLRDLSHRFLHPDSEAARLFARRRDLRKSEFEKKWNICITH